MKEMDLDIGPAAHAESEYPPETELLPGEEPTTTGTLFMVMVILMIIAAIWVIIYMRLLER